MSCKPKKDIVGGITSVTFIPMGKGIDLSNISDEQLNEFGAIKVDNSYPIPAPEIIDGKKYYPTTLTWTHLNVSKNNSGK